MFICHLKRHASSQTLQPLTLRFVFHSNKASFVLARVLQVLMSACVFVSVARCVRVCINVCVSKRKVGGGEEGGEKPRAIEKEPRKTRGSKRVNEKKH